MSGPRGTGPGPDGRHDDLPPDDLDAISLDIPDDASELDDDLERWRRGDDRTPDAPLPQAARRRRLVITAAVVLVSMVTVALSGAIGAWIVAPQAAPPQAAPLASGVPDPGQISGLLPDTPLEDAGAPFPARALRPAVIVLVPEQCADCAELLSSAAPQAASFGISLVAVGDDAQQVADLVETVGSTKLTGLTDPGGVLRATYGLTGTTLLLVRDDGVVVDIVRDPVPDIRLDGALVDLVPVTTT
jgi:hypothetical protein